MKKKLLVISLILAMTFVSSACGFTSREKSESRLQVIDKEWQGMDTYQLETIADGQGLVASPIFQWNQDLCKMDNYICKDWTVEEEEKYISFTVPEGMFFYNGKMVEPEDVKASLEHGAKVSPYKEAFEQIESIEIDEKERMLTLHVSEYKSAINYLFTSGHVTVIPKEELDTMSDEELLWGCHPYGLYYMEDGGYKKGEKIDLKRNDRYLCANPLVDNKGPAYFTDVTVRFDIEEGKRAEAVANGEADLALNVQYEEKAKLIDKDNIKFKESSPANTVFFELNTDQGIFQDIDVRKAFAFALDRHNIVSEMKGTIYPVYTIVSEGVANFSGDFHAYVQAELSDNPDLAEELLDDAGWKKKDSMGIRTKDGERLEFTVLVPAASEEEIKIASEQLKDIGFLMNVVVLEEDEIGKLIDDDNYQAAVRKIKEPMAFGVLDACYRDKNAPGNDEVLDYLNSVIKYDFDTATRSATVTEAEEYIARFVNIIPCYSNIEYAALNKNLKAYTSTRSRHHLFNDMKM